MKPIKFHPILKETIWGGDRISHFKSDLNSDSKSIGESWEISGLEGSESVVSDGEYRGMSLRELIRLKGESLVGKRSIERFGDEFPILVKFIAAHEDLSIQVHPSTPLAKELHNSHGKSEMWYVVDAEPGSRLYCGLKRELKREEYLNVIEHGEITGYMNAYDVTRGDVFYIPAGTLHSIGKGVLIAEIQEPSDITYRIFDYNRLDKWGKPRKLHIENARRALDFSASNNKLFNNEGVENSPIELISIPEFSTSLHYTTTRETLKPSLIGSFIFVTVIEGSLSITTDSDSPTNLNRGESALIPASCQEAVVTPTPTAKYISCHI